MEISFHTVCVCVSECVRVCVCVCLCAPKMISKFTENRNSYSQQHLQDGFSSQGIMEHEIDNSYLPGLKIQPQRLASWQQVAVGGCGMPNETSWMLDFS